MIPTLSIALIYVVLNAAAFLAFALDKRAAQRGGRRVRERTLLVLTLAGGAIGALAGRRIMRHKTLHARFAFAAWIAIASHIAIWALIVARPWPHA